MRRIFAGVVLAIAVTAPVRSNAAALERSAAPYIEVTAEAETRVAPDVAYVDFGVMTRADTASGAAEQNGARMKAVLAAVRAVIGPKSQIGTGNYSLRTEYTQPRDGSEPRVAGYVASNVVRLETPELARLGEVIDSAIKAGANQVQRIAFGLTDPASPRLSALRDAVLKAQSEAAAIAGALKVALGPVQSVLDQDLGPVRPFAQDAVAMRAQTGPTTPIEPGMVSVRARVVLRVQIAR